MVMVMVNGKLVNGKLLPLTCTFAALILKPKADVSTQYIKSFPNSGANDGTYLPQNDRESIFFFSSSLWLSSVGSQIQENWWSLMFSCDGTGWARVLQTQQQQQQWAVTRGYLLLLLLLLSSCSSTELSSWQLVGWDETSPPAMLPARLPARVRLASWSRCCRLQ
jgi:hypothetical protein